MKKQDLINSLDIKFYKVPEPQFVKEEFGIKEYRIFPYVKKTDIVYSQCVSFYVEDEGQPTETAYWGGSEPNPVFPEQFSDKVQTFIRTKIADGTVKFAYIVSLDSVLKKCLITAITNANISKSGMVSENAQGGLIIEIF